MLSLHDKTLLVKLFYKKDESGSLAFRSYRSMRRIKTEKGLMTITNLTAMIKIFEETLSLERQRNGRSQTSVVIENEVKLDVDT